MTQTHKLQTKELQKKFVLAKDYLNESQDCLKNKGLRLSADGAYNAAETIMKAGILLKNEDVPRRHGAIAQKFSLLFVRSGELDILAGNAIKQGFKFRNKARYDENAKITKEHAEHNIALAKKLIDFLEKKLKQN